MQLLPQETSHRPMPRVRVLPEGEDVFKHNAWDGVAPTEEDRARALETVSMHAQNPVPECERAKLLDNARRFWDRFYRNNQTNFFRDRHWLRLEFPELLQPQTQSLFGTDSNGESTKSQMDGGDNDKEDRRRTALRVMEAGCGVGNLVFPLFAEWQKEVASGAWASLESHHIYACDFSSTAIELVRSNGAYDVANMTAFVHDLTDPDLPTEVECESLDLIALVFVLSALPPRALDTAISKLYKLLRPGGAVLYRDYAQHDLAQLRMKKNRLIEGSLYRRGDNTLVNFLSLDDACELFRRHNFVVARSEIDHRLITNRKRQLCMNRAWLQCKFVKMDGGVVARE